MATQNFKYGGDFKGQVTFDTSPLIPEGTMGSHAVNKDQLDDKSYNLEYILTSDAVFSTSGSVNLSTNLVPDPVIFNNKIDWEVTWDESGIMRKISSYGDISEVGLSQTGGGTLVLHLELKTATTIPTGAKVILKF